MMGFFTILLGSENFVKQMIKIFKNILEYKESVVKMKRKEDNNHKRLVVVLSRDMHETLKRFAKKNNRTMSEMLRNWIIEGMMREQLKKKEVFNLVKEEKEVVG
jgi:molybdopterin-guanine dinucleotide biosynthesis protein A